MKKFLVGVAVVAIAATAWKWKSSSTETTSNDKDVMSAAADNKLVFDRIWIDHIPRNERDPFKIFLAISDDPFGAFQTMTRWTGSYEIFQYEAHGNEIRAFFPQNREKEKITAKGSKCDEQNMDYCLEMSGSSRGAKRYYSMKGWEIDGLASRDAVIEKVKLLVHDTTDVE